MNCSVCGKRSYNAQCVAHKPRKAIATRSPLPRPKKRIAQVGKEGEKWSATRHDWIRANAGKPLSCHYCGIPLTIEKLVIDHKIPRSRAPHLKYDFDNLVPACFICNTLKGSIEHDRFEHDCMD